MVPPVTAERSPPDSRITGADSPVIADSSTEAMPSTTSPSPGMTWPASTTTMVALLQQRRGDLLLGTPVAPGVQPVETAGHGVGLGPAQGVGLRLAAPLGDRLGEVGEQHGQPQPERRSARRTSVGLGDRQHGGQHARRSRR